MILGLVLVILGVSAAVTFVRPRVGLVLMWFFIFLYPNTALYGLLPLNLRFDNLWVVFVFLVCLFAAESRRTTTPVLRLTVLWVLSILGGSAVGLLTTPTDWQGVLKEAARNLYIPMTAYMLCTMLQDRAQIERYIFWSVVAAIACALLAIAMVYQPARFEAFFLPRIVETVGATVFEIAQKADTSTHRAQGTMGPIGLAIVMMLSSSLALGLALFHPRPLTRLFYLAATGICAVALVFSITRGAIGGLAIAVAAALAFSRRRGLLLCVVVVGVGAIVLQGSLVERVKSRLDAKFGSSQGQLDYAWTGRAAIVEHFIDNFSVAYVFFGKGFVATQRTEGMTIHNTYLGALVYCGTLGVIAMLLSIYLGASLGIRALRRTEDYLCQALGTCVLMALISILVYGLVAELFQTTRAMHIYFAFLALVETRLRQLPQAPTLAPTPLLAPTPVIMPGPYVPR